jgi:hypothetical protein
MSKSSPPRARIFAQTRSPIDQEEAQGVLIIKAQLSQQAAQISHPSSTKTNTAAATMAYTLPPLPYAYDVRLPPSYNVQQPPS